MKNNLSSALVFKSDYKKKRIFDWCENKNEMNNQIRFSYGKYFKTKRDVV